MENEKNIPNHIAIIMDGNGRWAKSKGKNRAFGHKQGTETVRRVMKAAVKRGVKYLTLYAFSTENWNRPKLEVAALMKLLASSLKAEAPGLMENDVRVKVAGDISRLSSGLQKSLNGLIEQTSNNKTLTITIALNYGSRHEIVNAAQQTAKMVLNGEIKPEDIDEKIFSDNLYTAGTPDPDLLIRTSGEFRISNFLLWQIAYSEVYITDVLWPDFSDEDLDRAIESYQGRERRFGKTSAQVNKC